MVHPRLQLISSCINPVGNDRKQPHPTGEWLLFSRSGSVKGYRIQHRVHHKHGVDTYADFSIIQDELADSVREVLAVNGKGVDYTDGARRVLHTQQERPLLNNGGERIRILDQTGVIVATYDLGNHCDVLPAAPKLPAVVPPIIRPSIPAAAAFGEVY
ncbi:hypothetical protein GCM10017784_11010 [Deinococcus indicus]|nr:hypothetical protein GCM10017784_11010 [Deinococcus indicus]